MNKMQHILFWSEYNSNMSKDDFVNHKIDLSPFHKLSLLAHEKLDNEVVLFTYQKFNDRIPKNVTIKNAGEYFPIQNAYDSLQDGHSIAHISDAVRLKYASIVKGVVLDMDAILLKKLPTEFGWFASMPAKRSGGVAPQWGEAHPPLTIHDKSWNGQELAAFPIRVSESMKIHVESLSHKIMHTLLETPKTNSKAWNYVIWTLKIIMKRDTNYRVLPPIAFCPVPAWLGAGKCYSIQSPTKFNGENKLFGYPLPHYRDILENSYIVQHFFESAFVKSEKVSDNFWNDLPDDCLVSYEAKHILGENYKKILNEY